MQFETLGDRQNPAVLFFHAMGVTGASSRPVAQHLQDSYFCILPTSTVYCEGQTYCGKEEEVRQTEEFLHKQGVSALAQVVASSIGADLALTFLSRTALPVGHVFFDGGQFAQIRKAARWVMTPLLYLAIKSLYWSKGRTLKKSCGATMMRSNPILLLRAKRCAAATCAASLRTAWRISRSRRCQQRCRRIHTLHSAAWKSTINTGLPS